MVSKQHSGSHLLVLTPRPPAGLQLFSTVFRDWELRARTITTLLLCCFWQSQTRTLIRLLYLHGTCLSPEVSWETALELHSLNYATVTESGMPATTLSQKEPRTHQKKNSGPNHNIIALTFIFAFESKESFQTSKNWSQSKEVKVFLFQIFLYSTLSINVGHFVSEVS